MATFLSTEDRMVDEETFGEWVSNNSPALIRTARRMVGDLHVAEDIVQETFRSAWCGRRRFEEGREDKSWLFAILRRRVVDYWRRSKADDMMEFVESPVHDSDPFDSELSGRMISALDSLPSGMKDAFLLVAVDELTHREVSVRLGVPIGTVLSRFSRARERMRRVLSQG
jgi:RNA polymerase sigma-70 factor (ECF subfamily)